MDWKKEIGAAAKEALERSAQEIKTRAQRGVEKAKVRFVDHTVDTYKEYVKNAVAAFYADYTPIIYRDRSYSLYDVAVVKGSETGFKIEMYPEKMTYRDGSQSGDSDGSLFDLVFVQGWHGGADHGPGHPGDGKPYWRTPHPTYKYWHTDSPAARSPSPYDEIVTKTSEYLDTEAQELWENLVGECVVEALREE